MKTQPQREGERFSPFFDETQDTVIDFLRRRLPMVLAINTVIALLIALLLRSWDAVVPNLVVSYCIGFTILALIASVRCTVMQRFRGRMGLRFVIYFALVAAGAIGGELLSQIFLQQPANFLHEPYTWFVAIRFLLAAGSMGLCYNCSCVRRAQTAADV